MNWIRSFARWCIMLTAVLVISSCGGGGGAIVSALGGGVGTGGTGFTLGTIIGFGSIITDSDSSNHYSSATGIYYAGTSAAASSVTSATVLGVGQQVEITLDSNGNPTVVQSVPSVVGAVTAITQTSGTTTSFVVNNLTININTSLSQGPVTYFVGYTGANAITVNDQVEVHGFYAQDGSGKPYIQATRVVLLPATNTVTRTVGIIPSGYTSGNFTLAGSSSLSGEAISVSANPVITLGSTGASTTLASGQFVSVWSSAAAASNTITANAIRVRQISTALGTVKVTGLVYGKNGTGFFVSGISVDGSATNLSSTVSGLTNGTYVVIAGTANSSGGLVASTITASNSGSVELKGTITNFVNVSSFQVRGTLVNASALSSSVTSALANGVYVDVLGTVSGNAIVASSFNSILSSVPSSSTVEYVGTITAVNGSSSFTMLAQNGNSYSFALATNAGYEGAGSTACTLATGARVNVEATLSGSTYTAYGIQCLLASGSNAQSGTTEVAGVVSNVTATGSAYSFEVNNVRVTGTGSLPSSFVDGANVDVHINNTNTNASTVSSSSVPHVDD